MADEKVINNLVVQGRTVRDIDEYEELEFIYRGEKLEDNDSYANRDVVGKIENSDLKFYKYDSNAENHFMPYNKFPEDIKDKRFETESVYYNNLNNGFNVCRNSSLNILNMLNPYSSTNDVLYKDSDFQLVSDNIKNSLENFIKYYFYEKESLTGLYINSKDSSNIKLGFVYNYNTSKYSFSQKETYLNFKIDNANDESLIFEDTTLKHINRTDYEIGKENKSGWDQSGYYSIYDIDKQGHIINRSDINLTFPRRPRLKKYVLYNGERNNGTFSSSEFNYTSSELKNYMILEFIFKSDPCYITGNINTPMYTSVFVDTSFIEYSTSAVKFKGIRFETTSDYWTDKYGNRHYSYTNNLITENFDDNILIPTNTGGGIPYEITYNKIVKIIGYISSIY